MIYFLSVGRTVAMDSHYTPPAIANLLVEAANDLSPKLIADLAAGNGNLLLAAERKWPTAKYVATDIDRIAIRRLARLRPSWTVGCCDLRNKRSRNSCSALKNIHKSVCLLLLNPPFSCRGGTRFLVTTKTTSLYVSTAMSFLLHALEYVGDTGHIASVLPHGCVHSQKDASAWDNLHNRYHVQTLKICPVGTFPNSAAKTVLVRLSPRQMSRPPQIARQYSNNSPENNKALRVQVIRGTCPIHRIQSYEESNPVLVHYTDIRNGLVNLDVHRGSGNYRCIRGPAVIIPRVGNITVRKIALLDTYISVMLSDCVIALKPELPEQTAILKEKLLNAFPYLSSLYVGTGAPFITVNRLISLLRSIGVKVAG